MNLRGAIDSTTISCFYIHRKMTVDRDNKTKSVEIFFYHKNGVETTCHVTISIARGNLHIQ